MDDDHDDRLVSDDELARLAQLAGKPREHPVVTRLVARLDAQIEVHDYDFAKTARWLLRRMRRSMGARQSARR